jgi:hypothetical protein
MPRRVTTQPDFDGKEIERRWRMLSGIHFLDPRTYALDPVNPVDPGAAALAKSIRERVVALDAGGAPLGDRLSALESFLDELGVLADAEAYLEQRKSRR